MTLAWIILLLLMSSHIGIAWNILLSPGNILDWLNGYIDRIKYEYLKDLLTCAKCVSGQFGLWSYVFVCIRYHFVDIDNMILIGVLWVSSVIVVTDQLMRRYGYA